MCSLKLNQINLGFIIWVFFFSTCRTSIRCGGITGASAAEDCHSASPLPGLECAGGRRHHDVHGHILHQVKYFLMKTKVRAHWHEGQGGGGRGSHGGERKVLWLPLLPHDFKWLPGPKALICVGTTWGFVWPRPSPSSCCCDPLSEREIKPFLSSPANGFLEESFRYLWKRMRVFIDTEVNCRCH